MSISNVISIRYDTGHIPKTCLINKNNINRIFYIEHSYVLEVHPLGHKSIKLSIAYNSNTFKMVRELIRARYNIKIDNTVNNNDVSTINEFVMEIYNILKILKE